MAMKSFLAERYVGCLSLKVIIII